MAAKQPTLNDFRRLQAAVDEATTAWSEAQAAGVYPSELEAHQDAIAAAKLRISQTIAAAPDPDAARWNARHAMEDPNRESKPASIGARLTEGVAARAARRRGTAA